MGTMERNTPKAKNSLLEIKLLEACKFGNDKRVRLLLETGVSANTRDDKYGYTALVVACIANTGAAKNDRQHMTVNVLLSNNADVNATHEGGKNVLHFCAMLSPKADLVSKICESRPDEKLVLVNAQDCDGNTPLSLLCSSHVSPPRDTVNYLLANGADVNRCNNSGVTPLQLVAQEGNQALVQCFIEHGANVNSVDKSNRTALNIACNKYKQNSGDYYHRTVKNLLLAGANANIACKYGMTPLYHSIARKATCITDALLENVATCWKAHDSKYRTALHWVYNQWESYPSRLDAKLLHSGADPNAQDSNRCVPIEYALQNITTVDYPNASVVYYTGNNSVLASIVLNIQAGLNIKLIDPKQLEKLVKFVISTDSYYILQMLYCCGLKWDKNIDDKDVKLLRREPNLICITMNVIRSSLKPNALCAVGQLPLPERLKRDIVLQSSIKYF